MTNGLIKLCGLGRESEVAVANALQPDYVGMVVEYPKSPRSMTLVEAAKLVPLSAVPVVGVVVDPSRELIQGLVDAGLKGVQLSGSESVDFVRDVASSFADLHIFKVIHLSGTPDESQLETAITLAAGYTQVAGLTLMLDTRVGDMPGGTGATGSWEAARRFIAAVDATVLLAGGLTPENVAAAIGSTQPAGVDVSGGIESSPGLKDADKMESFTHAARAAFASL